MSQRSSESLLRIRRGWGLIFILSGLFFGGEMVLAVLASLHRLPFIISGRLWSELYYAHFLLTVLAAGLHLFFSFMRDGLFHAEALSDFLVGIGVFFVLFSVCAVLLMRMPRQLWLAFATPAFLLAYGRGLRAGRPFGFGRHS